MGDHRLRRRLVSFDFDTGGAPGYFVDKLAHDNSWSRAYAARVVDEYLRYLELACNADHLVVPSDQVDQAWHQHLLDTEQYWNTFCPNVLGRHLHHHPNKDGTVGRHLNGYRRTLATYRAIFGNEPPTDIWPTPEQRFAVHPQRRGRRLATTAVIALAVLSPAVVAFTRPDAAAAAWLDPSNDATFGWVFMALALVAIGSSAILARVVGRNRKAPLHAHDEPIEPYDAAVLEGAHGRAVSAAVAALVCDGSLDFDDEALAERDKEYRLVRTGPMRPDAHPLERGVCAEVEKGLFGLPLRDVYAPLASTTGELRDSLCDRGLLAKQSLAARAVIVTPLVVVGALGVARIVGYGSTALVNVTLVVLAIAAVLWLVIERSARPTATGDAALAAASDAHPKPDSFDSDVRDGRSAAWTVVLHGPGALVGPLALVGAAILAPRTEGGSGGSSASCGGGSGCGGGCGGGCG